MFEMKLDDIRHIRAIRQRWLARRTGAVAALPLGSLSTVRSVCGAARGDRQGPRPRFRQKTQGRWDRVCKAGWPSRQCSAFRQGCVPRRERDTPAMRCNSPVSTPTRRREIFQKAAQFIDIARLTATAALGFVIEFFTGAACGFVIGGVVRSAGLCLGLCAIMPLRSRSSEIRVART